MNKLIIILILFALTLPVFAKTKQSQYEFSIGSSKFEVKKALGNPSIVTNDSDNVQTWIYENVSTLPIKNCLNFGWVNENTKDTIVIIKFDKDENVSEYSYHKSVF